MMPKAIVLLSGGIDSATALWWTKKKGYDTYALTFKYGNWNKNEIKVAKKLVKLAKIKKHIILDVNFLNEIQDLKSKYLLKKFPTTYIPSRNTIFFGIASHYAEILGINYIVTGHSSIDPFPDSKPKYVEAMNNALRQGSWLGKGNNIKIVMPIAKLDKIGIVKLARKLNVPLELTWSCYKNGKYPCGKCNGCTNRLKVFENIKVDSANQKILPKLLHF